MSAPQRWKLHCPWCAYFIDAAQESGAGEAAAGMMVDHLAASHPGKDWQDFLSMSSGEVMPGGDA